jgi:tetratricopeptide (TPR) repeat protein
MAVDSEFETETMAQIYAAQGHYEKAAAIYRRLLDRAPDREELRSRLDAVEALRQRSGGERLSGQFSEWVRLLLKKKQIDDLRRFHKPR